MMVCPGCGKNVKDGVKFCPHCGADVPETAPAVETAAQEPILGKKKRKGSTIAVMVVAAVAVIAAVALGVNALFSSPKKVVEKAMHNSLEELKSTSEIVGTDVWEKAEKDMAYSETLSLGLKKLNIDGFYGSGLNPSMLEGLKAEVEANVDLPKRVMDLSMDLRYGSVDVLSMKEAAKDEMLSFSFPQILGDTAYTLNTTTMGKDFHKMNPSIPEEMGFNLFDLAEKFSKQLELKEANKALMDAIQVEKLGKEDVEVNDTTLSCKGYQVLIPEDAMKDWIKAVEDAIDALGYDDATADMMMAMGVPEAEASAVKEQGKAERKAFFANCKELVKEVGDLELEVYVHGNYIVAAEWSDTIDGTKTDVNVYLGGGDRYVDDFTLEVKAGENKMKLISSGDHSANSGTFTDESRLVIDGETLLRSEMSYDTKAKEDNLTWDLTMDVGSVNMKGTIQAEKDTFTLDMDQITFQVPGVEVVLEMELTLKPYAAGYTPKDTVMIADLDEADWAAINEEANQRAQQWLMGLIQDIPALQAMFLG